VRIIIVNSIDGHVLAFEWNHANARALVGGYLKANEYTTRTDDADELVELLQRFSENEQWLEEAAETIQFAAGDRTHGNEVNVVDVEPELTENRLYQLIV